MACGSPVVARKVCESGVRALCGIRRTARGRSCAGCSPLPSRRGSAACPARTPPSPPWPARRAAGCGSARSRSSRPAAAAGEHTRLGRRRKRLSSRACGRERRAAGRVRSPRSIPARQKGKSTHLHEGVLYHESAERAERAPQHLVGDATVQVACGAPHGTPLTARPRLVRVRRTYSSALSLRYVQHAGGWYAWPVRAVRRRPRDVRVSLAGRRRRGWYSSAPSRRGSCGSRACTSASLACPGTPRCEGGHTQSWGEAAGRGRL